MFKKLTTAVAVALLAASCARAGIIDLTTAGSSGTANGATFVWTNLDTTGSGLIDSFVRVQGDGTEAGYNTDGTLEFQTKPGGFTHSLLLAGVPIFTDPTTGVKYLEFLLDINESGSGNAPLLSLNDLVIYQGNAPNLTGYDQTNPATNLGGNAIKKFDLDSGPDGDTTVEMNYDLNPGSGRGDVFVYIPLSFFDLSDAAHPYLYLYSKFGNANQSNDGFEEWAISANGEPIGPGPQPQAVPEPGTMTLALSGLVGFGVAGLRRFRRRVVA